MSPRHEATPRVDQWAERGLLLVPRLFGRNVRQMRFNDYGPTFVELDDGSEYTSTDQGRTWDRLPR